MQLKPVIYRVASRAAGRRALEALGHAGAVKAPERAARLTTYLDTFDWRVFRAGARLSVENEGSGSRLIWSDCAAGSRHRLAIERAPAFAWDLPSSPARETLERVVEMRRLIPRVAVRIETLGAALLDERSKTVCRVLLEYGVATAPEDGAREGPLEPVLRVVPVRGYPAAFEATLARLDGRLEVARDTRDEMERGLEAIGRQAGDVPAKQRYDIAPGLRADDAMKRIHGALLATFRLNLPGLLAQIDSEFLHDARVAVRRTRSALGQVPGVFPENVVARFKEDLSWLGRLTGPTRDMDVWLLGFPRYRAMLPEARRADLDPLQELIRERQAEEHRRLVEALDSERFARLIGDWSEFLESPTPGPDSPADAARPIEALARERIWRAWRRAMRRGRSVGPDSPAELLHRLRIDCKKLRYLLEFFVSLQPEGAVAPLVAALKRLQTNLGDLNDLEVQRETLRDLEEQLAGRSVAPRTVEAVERLVATLEERRVEERRRFDACFAAFAANEIEAEFRRLFEPPADVTP